MTRQLFRGPRQRLRAAVGAIACTIALSSCASIPLSGPVQTGAEVLSAENEERLYYPASPMPGMSPVDLVSGFVDAGTGTADNYRVSREYLSQDAGSAWDPTASTIVVTDAPTYEAIGEDTVRATFDVVATIDEHGRYTEVAPSKTMQRDYRVGRVGDQWRITEAPHGTVLLQQNFENIFRDFTLFFLDGDERFLVPEVRWFPSRSTAPTRLVQALLAGPSSWLAEAGVKTMFPPGTKLLGPVIPESGTAPVNFSQTISGATGSTFSLMKLQLDRTLEQVTSIATVDMLVNSAKIEVSAPGPDTVIAQSQVGTLPLAVRNGEIGFLSGDTLTPAPATNGLSYVLPGLKPRAGAVATRAGVSAFLTPEGVVAVQNQSGAIVPLDPRTDLLSPIIGPSGFVATLTPTSATMRVSNPLDGYGTEIAIPQVGQTRIVSAAFSRSGTVIAIAIERGNHAAVVIAAVGRDPQTRRPIALGQPKVIDVEHPHAVDLTWVDGTTLALLAADASGETEVIMHQVGGATTRTGALDGGVAIEGSSTPAGLRVLGQGGQVFVPRGNQWQPSGGTVEFFVAQV